jgi:hypothetical protein
MGSNNLYIHLRTKDARVPWVHRLQVPYVADEMGWVLDAYEYTPDGVIFYDDGKIVGKAEWKNLTAQQAVWLTALNGCGEVDTTALPGESLFKYFRYYAKDYPGINLLPNGNFEYNQDATNPEYPVAWTTSEGTGSIKVIKANAAKDLYKLRISSEKSFRVLLQQKLEFIRNGEYILTAKVRANCTTGNAKIKVNGEDNEMLIPNSEHWKSLVLKDIIISNNEACISIEIDGDVNEWIEVDDVKFMKPAVKHVKVIDNEPFTLIKDPVWQLAQEEPVIFTGNDKFFFFDRFVGFGDAISVAFTLTVNQMNNMTPIARIPKTGKSGWAIALAKDGSLVFRIGSKENHTDVVARNGYMVDKPCKIVCQFNKGTASVYLDGRLLTEVKGIPQNTLDETAAGKLGSLGNGYEAINGVVQDTDGNITEISKSNNFKGELQQVKIYNRAIY